MPVKKPGSRSADTRALILATALRLFNERGAGAVTVRDIAAAAGISHGNLCYHFPNIDALVTQLYEELVAQLNAGFSAAEQKTNGLRHLHTLTVRTFELLYAYRFLMLDFVAIMRRNESIKLHFQALQRMRAQQFEAIWHQLKTQDLLRPDPLPGHFEHLREQWSILGDYWISHSEVLYTGTEQDKIPHYTRVFFSMLLPYLNENGVAEYQKADL